MKHILKFLLVFLVYPLTAFADVKVLDGDSLIINDSEVRLIGVDAPEYRQICFDEEEIIYDCSEEAKNALVEIINGGKIECVKLGKDIYDRNLSECFTEELNINIELLKSGWAVLYRSEEKTYVKAQREARENKRGLWRGRFMKPEFHRVLNRNKKDKNFL
ncbi:MAG: thermonuclease family protein [Lactobacillaceae bacterium]|jgi:endonuclease YncB( thermonuclease family)|nr:thermonuclease family protein [Lactobacillaceae bacterium]